MGSRLLSQPRVIRTTVIIPVFNHESLTRQCLEAVLGTVGNDVEMSSWTMPRLTRHSRCSPGW